MDEEQYKNRYKELNTRPCVFGRAIQRGCLQCRHAQKMLLAERELMGCTSAHYYGTCEQLSCLLHEKARFPLHLPHTDEPLPFAKEMKVQCGGLLGIYLALPGNKHHDGGEKPEMSRLLGGLANYYPNLDKLPFSDVVKFISHYQLRKR